MRPAPATRLRRAGALQARYEGELNPAGEMLLRREAFLAYYALRQEGRGREAQEIVRER